MTTAIKELESTRDQLQGKLRRLKDPLELTENTVSAGCARSVGT